ncbi:MAG: TlpA family protein disulfide reductase, partial [Candidatus Thorarchaeota archaeon]
VTLVIVTIGLLTGVTFLTFPADDGGDDPLTKYSTDRDLLELGLSAPDDWEFEMSDDTTLLLSDLQGQVVLVDLMATWCGTCLTQNNYLETVSENLADTTIVISLTVDPGESTDLMANYKSQKGLNWAHGIDTDSSFKNYFNVVSVPTMVLIDSDGVFRYLHIGLWSTATITDTIASIL